MMILDLSLNNAALYRGCIVEVVAGRYNLTTPIGEAVNIIGKNIAEMVAATPMEERGKVVLTGPMAVWAYLVVFHAVVHAFNRVWYSDGKNPEVLIAAHGP